MLVSTRRNDSFLKWGRQFPQAGTTVSSSGNGSNHKQDTKKHIFFTKTGFLSSVFATFARSFGFTSPDSVGEE